MYNSFDDWWESLLDILISENRAEGADKQYWKSYYEEGYTPYGAIVEEECND